MCCCVLWGCFKDLVQWASREGAVGEMGHVITIDSSFLNIPWRTVTFQEECVCRYVRFLEKDAFSFGSFFPLVVWLCFLLLAYFRSGRHDRKGYLKSAVVLVWKNWPQCCMRLKSLFTPPLTRTHLYPSSLPHTILSCHNNTEHIPLQITQHIV